MPKEPRLDDGAEILIWAKRPGAHSATKSGNAQSLDISSSASVHYGGGRKHEINTAFAILLHRRRKVKLSQCDSSRPPLAQII